MTIKQKFFNFVTFPFLSFIPNFGDFLQNHIEKIIESKQLPCELSLVFHYHPELLSNAFIEQRQRHHFYRAHSLISKFILKIVIDFILVTINLNMSSPGIMIEKMLSRPIEHLIMKQKKLPNLEVLRLYR